MSRRPVVLLGLALPRMSRSGLEHRDDEDGAALKQGGAGEVELGELQVLYFFADRGGAAGEEAGLDAVGDDAQAQVHGSGLDLAVGNGHFGANLAVGDELANILRGQNTGAAGLGANGLGRRSQSVCGEDSTTRGGDEKAVSGGQNGRLPVKTTAGLRGSAERIWPT